MRKTLFNCSILFAVLLAAMPAPAMAKEWIAYSHLTGDYWQIWMMGPDGSHKQQLTFSPQDKRDPAWINHGKELVYRTSNSQFFVMDKDGKNEHQILAKFPRISNPSFCEKTGEIIFVRFDPVDLSDIWKADKNGNNAVMLTKTKGLMFHPAASASGGRIAFIKADREHAADHVWMMDADGGNAAALTSGEGRDVLPAFSPDEGKIAFTSDRDSGDYEIYILDLTTKKTVRLTTSPGLDTSANFSPDGQKIIFVSTRSGNQQIWSVAADGTTAVQLTDGEESVDPDWTNAE